MTAKHWLPSSAIVITLVSTFLAGILGLTNPWGISHLVFLSDGWRIAFAILAAVSIVVSFSTSTHRHLTLFLSSLDKIVYGSQIYTTIALAVAAMILFWLMRMPTHFLGDGYEWIASFSKEGTYIHKWTEFGSTYMVRGLQWILGGFTETTARPSFQILSVVSGSIAVFSSISIIKQLTESVAARLVATGTLFSSGALLLYFGYVEFYPMIWALVLLYFFAAIRYLKKGQDLWLVVLTFFLALFMHVQAIILFGGLLYLLIGSLEQRRWRLRAWSATALLGVVGIVGFIYLHQTRVDVRVLMLPFTEGRGFANDYTVISLRHWYDLLQLVLLVFPGSLVLLTFLVRARPTTATKSTIALSGMFIIRCRHLLTALWRCHYDGA